MLLCKNQAPFFSSSATETQMESWERNMIAQAKEELQVLETQYPNRFDYMKRELKSFIFLLESQNLTLHDYNDVHSSSSPASTASTQASSCGKKRKKSGSDEACKVKLQKGSRLGRRDRVDVVLDRAEACLRKIQELKTSLC